ncbi:hypothetical protein D068_cds03500 [Bacillus atrophaeus UCMB-5137]|nr:hypothetical protein D068_cds03500 [Bacillus atrophaeus UCMB-5137]
MFMEIIAVYRKNIPVNELDFCGMPHETFHPFFGDKNSIFI